MPKRFTSFAEFYPIYLKIHDHPINRGLHVVGNLLALAALVFAILARSWPLLLAVPVLGNGFAWVGHYRFQRNRPGVFTYPFYGFLGNWVMIGQILLGRLRSDGIRPFAWALMAAIPIAAGLYWGWR